jgi:hypothetical protein
MIPSFKNYSKISLTYLEKLNKDEKIFEEYYSFLTHLLDKYFQEQIYQSLICKINCLALSEQIKDFFKRFYQRYRIIVQLYIGQQLDQAILITSRSLWDKSHDSFLQQIYSKQTIFALVNIFFIYKE